MQEYAPRAGDDRLQRGSAFTDSADSISTTGVPSRYALTLKGNLPTPCHELRVAYSEPAPNNRINLEVYSVSNPDVACTQMLAPFEQVVDLGGLPAGRYTVWINGQQMAEFDA